MDLMIVKSILACACLLVPKCSTVFAMDKPLSLHQVLGRRLRKLRTASGRLQEDVASAARAWGFDWQRGTVAMIELGRRRVTAEELLALPAIARDAGLGGLHLGDLVENDVMVVLSPFAGAGALHNELL